jgi:hypothetical protein
VKKFLGSGGGGEVRIRVRVTRQARVYNSLPILQFDGVLKRSMFAAELVVTPLIQLQEFIRYCSTGTIPLLLSWAPGGNMSLTYKTPLIWRLQC